MEIDNFLSRFKSVRRSGDSWSVRCPAHEDNNNSLSIAVGDKGIVIKCHAGCDADDVMRAVGLGMSDLFPDNSTEMSSHPRRSGAHAHTVDGSKTGGRGPDLKVIKCGVTLAEYAEAKSVPEAFLRELGLSDRKHANVPAISIPYFDVNGRPIAVRYRIALLGDRFRWRKDSKLQLYGLSRLDQARKAGFAVIVEGESDCHTAWHHGIPALGIPGANAWREERDAQHFDGIEKIYVVIEPDAGGEAVSKWISKSSIKDRVYVVDLGPHKDLSALHLASGARFGEAWRDAIAGAKAFSQLESKQADAERARASEDSCGLIDESDILSKFAEAIVNAGVVGEVKTAKLLYLALTSRFFSRPISIVVKGPSSAGKSFVTESVLKFFPEDAYYSLTAMSDRSLAYSDEPLEHRFIVVFEAAGLESDIATYMLRSLLSEGRVRYETVEKTSEGMKPRLIERKGPTGCILTTTAASLHGENETRMLSVTISDSPQQTRIILDRLGKEMTMVVDFVPWRALQTWMKVANHEVTIPYSELLVALVPEIAVRLRRDIHHVLTLIKAHAMLHQNTRERDADGRIVATLDDYRVIYELVADIIGEGVEATVRPEVRATVEAVGSLVTTGLQTVTVKQVAAILRLDASTVSRRVAVARNRGYLKNEETRRRQPAKLVIGDEMPSDIEVLPHPDRLRDGVHVCTSDQGDNKKEYSDEPMVEDFV